MLRYIVGDENNTLYSDTKLKNLLVVAAQFVVRELSFTDNYTINFANLSISPDPVTAGDYAFTNLVVLKASCLLATSEYKLKGRESISWKNGPSSLDTTSSAKDASQVRKVICDDYEAAKAQYLFGDSIPGAAILGPFSSDRTQGFGGSRMFS